MMDKPHFITFVNAPAWSPEIPGTHRSVDNVIKYMDKGALVSEVGFPTMVDTWCGKVAGFNLRRSRISPKTRPVQPFGRLLIPDAMGTHVVSEISLPKAGTSVTFNPKIKSFLKTLRNSFEHVRADVTYVFCFPMAFGASFLLQIEAPEIDSSTTTRCVRWKPSSGLESLAVTLGWDCDVPLIHGTTARKGFSGLSIKLTCIEDNSQTSIPQPYKGVLYTYVHNLEYYGIASPFGKDEICWDHFNFNPMDPKPDPKSLSSYPVAQSGEVGDAPTVGEGPLEGVDLSGEEITPPPPPTDAVVAPSAPLPAADGSNNARPSAIQALQSKWIKLTTFVLAGGDKPKPTFTFDQVISRRTYKGEDIRVPFGKHVWCSSSRRGDTLRGLEFKLVSNRNPQMAGFIRCDTGINDSGRHNTFWHVLGDNNTTFFEYGDSYLNKTNTRTVNSPWVRTSVWRSRIMFTLYGFNAAQASTPSVSATLFVRPGGMRFNVPTKPKPRPKGKSSTRSTGLDDNFIQSLCDALSEYQLEETVIAQAGEQSGQADVAPDPTDQPFLALANPLGIGEQPLDIEQGQFWVRAGDINLPTDGTVMGITLDLPTILDKNGLGGDNQITELFHRYVDITPTCGGAFGPTVGKYVLKVRPPATFTADIEHVCLPPEMNDETALRLFGLDSILGIAGSAINSIGGSLLGGALNTVGDLVGGLFGGLLGGKDPESSKAPETSAPVIAGEIPFTRFLEFFKSFEGSEDNEKVWPTLLMKLVNVLDASMAPKAVATVPATLYLRLEGLEATRASYERTVVPPPTRNLSLSLPVDLDGFNSFLRSLSDIDTQEAKDLSSRAVSVLARSSLPTFEYDLVNLRDEPYASQAHLDTLRRAFPRHLQ